jgi:outer membrane receptor for ferrienterochelin and colicins
MKYILMAILAMSVGYVCHGQHKMTAIVKDKSTKEPLVGVTCHISGTGIGNTTEIHGVVTISDVPEGAREVVFQYVGYETVKNQLVFPVNETDTLEVMLASNEEELEGITISSTRSSRTISDIPTRVEFIAGEELEEKGNMKPGDIRMLLAESTGIQTQQTSATSATASIRIQGLDGRYTQILKDGFPLYSGAASGLGLLQIPPLDLKQVEVIKGSSSTLYGGGAIAGMVNLISKTPTDERDLRFIVNGTSAGGLDVSGFTERRPGTKA